MPSHSLNARALVVCLGLTFAFSAPLFGGGSAESRLAPAERLIEAQDYSGALLLLTQLQRQSPDLSEETTRLISQVIIVRGKAYNEVLAGLLRAMFVEEDDDKSVKLIAQLQKIDPTRAAAEVAFGTDFIHLLRLMNDASSRLAAGRIVDALSLYLLPIADPVKAGFDMQKPHFESAGYGPIVTSSVNEAVAQLLDAGRQQVKASQALTSVPTAVGAFLKSPAAMTSPDTFDTLVSPLIQVAQAEEKIRKLAAFFQSTNKSIGEKAGKASAESYLRYLSWLCLGRDKKVEGIEYALRRLWEDKAEEVEKATNESAVKGFQAARALYDSGSLVAADTAFTDVGYRSIVAVKAAALAGSGSGGVLARGQVLPPDRLASLHGHLSKASAAQEMAAEAGAFHILIGYRHELDRLPVVNPGAAVDPARAAEETVRLTDARATLEIRSLDARGEQAAWRERSAAWTTRVPTGVDVLPLAQSARAVADLFGAFVDTSIQEKDLTYAVRLAKLAGAGFPGRLDAAVALRREGLDLKNGTRNGEIPTSQVGLLEKHPELAVPVFQDAGSRLDALIKDLGAFEEGLTKEKPYVAASADYTALFKGTRTQKGFDQLLGSSQEERRGLDKLMAETLQQMEDAAVASREGDSQFTLAENALNKRDSEAATSYVDKAADKYVQSQSIAWTKHAVTRTDVDIPDLQRRIAALRNRIAIDAATKAIVAIRGRFEAKDYLGASDLLDAAERLWSQTQVGTYPLFDNLRQNIRNALDLSAGRDISRLDPKADVVNTFIKYAQDSLAAGKLQEAAANVKDALAVAPNYGTAKVLELKIKKQTDPAGFQRDASEQIAAFLKMAGESSNPDRQKIAYNALLDYSKLDPAFAAQTKATILELEYDLKIRRRPANPQQMAQSNALVQQADRVQQQGTAEAYQQALELLKQALQVNPDNAAAVRLDLDVRSNLSKTALTALSRADTGKYKQALSLYISGAYQDAYDIVMGLWNDPRSPRNKTYDQLQKLKKRCEVALNIL